MPLSSLDESGIRQLTDKCSLYHDYLSTYERLFEPYRNQAITLLEIGVFNGGSVKMWESHFPHATIVGVDVNPDCRQYAGGRRVIEIASQADAAAMAELGEKYRPAIIIDDGSHRADHIRISFDALYPFLRPSGLYIVEDVAMHIGASGDTPRMRGDATTPPQRWLLELAHATVCPGDNPDHTLNHAAVVATEAVEFVRSMAVIRKKRAVAPDDISSRRQVVEELNSHLAWGWLSAYILRSGGSTAEAVTCAKRAVEMHPNAQHCQQLSHALRLGGDLPEALAAIQQAIRLDPNPGFIEQAKAIAREMEARRV